MDGVWCGQVTSTLQAAHPNLCGTESCAELVRDWDTLGFAAAGGSSSVSLCIVGLGRVSLQLESRATWQIWPQEALLASAFS